jgi:hypothetical protein
MEEKTSEREKQEIKRGTMLGRKEKTKKLVALFLHLKQRR